MEPLATALVAALLLGAAGLKALDRTATAVSFEALGLHGPAARRTVVGLVALEAATAIALLAGVRGSAAGAAGLFGGFVVAQLVLLATGRRGAPCGCLGRGSRLGPSSLARAALPGALALALALALTGGAVGARAERAGRDPRARRPRPGVAVGLAFGLGRALPVVVLAPSVTAPPAAARPGSCSSDPACCARCAPSTPPRSASPPPCSDRGS